MCLDPDVGVSAAYDSSRYMGRWASAGAAASQPTRPAFPVDSLPPRHDGGPRILFGITSSGHTAHTMAPMADHLKHE